MRGKVFPVPPQVFKSRITPAYAGKRTVILDMRYLLKDHPRLCGEKLFQLFCGLFCHGSPPPMRGKDKWHILCDTLCRITPAYAGKSWIPITQFFNIQDHPRLCGEKDLCRACVGCRQGSPPPMRGKASGLQSDKLISRITPAYAGKSQRRLVVVCFGQDHPRLCGEKTKRSLWRA